MDMNVYRMIGNHAGTPEALDLAERLSTWHDAMVAHERGAGEGCDEECPHAEAGPLWDDAVRTFGDRAEELQFLKARARPRADSSSKGGRAPGRSMQAGV